MRVLQVVPTYLPAVRHGGPVRAVHGLSRALAARGHEVVVFTTNQHADGVLDLDSDRAELDGVGVRYFEVGRPRRLARSPGMAVALVSELGGFDLVHLHSLFLWPTAAAARAAERAGVPWVVSPRGMLVEELVRKRGRLRKVAWLRLVERRTLERARRLIVTSELERVEAGRFDFALPPIEILANGVDLESAADPAGLPEEWRSFLASGVPFLYLGRLSWKKGIDRLIRAVARLPEARLVIAGNDEEGVRPRLEALAREILVADRVRFVGFVDGASKQALLAAARALVLPSLSENFGNVVLEAWVAGTPVVVTPGVGLADEVESAGAGLVAAGDPVALGDALERLVADPEAARAMGELGRARVESRYAWPTIAERAESIYAAVLAESPRERATP